MPARDFQREDDVTPKSDVIEFNVTLRASVDVILRLIASKLGDSFK